MINDKKITAEVNPAAQVSLQSDFATKIIKGQIQNGYILEISFRRNKEDELEFYWLCASDAARSLLLVSRTKQGVTRAEALDQYFILSLTQHIHRIREHCNFWDAIETERVKPKGYARYHKPAEISVRILMCGGQ